MTRCTVTFILALLSLQVHATSYRHTAAQAYARNYVQATELLIRDIGSVPQQEEWPAILIEQPKSYSGWNGPYIRQASADPWSNEFKIRIADGQFIGVYSIGKNGLDENGVGDDVTSWKGYDKNIYHPNRLRKLVTFSLLLISSILISVFFLSRHLSKRKRR